MAPVERAHAKIGPSSLARVFRCPGSVNFIESLEVKDTAGDAAHEGTILHSFAEDCLTKGLDPFDLVGEVRSYSGYEYELTEDDAQGIQEGLDVIDDIPGKLMVETRVSLDRYMPEQFGTCDIAVIGKKTVTIADWKFGGNPVSPVENEQLMAYALGMWDNHARHMINDSIPDEDIKFRLMIFQPRAPGGGGEWQIWLDDLLKFGKKLTSLSKQVCDPKAKRIAGEKQCLYCPGALLRKCPEYDKFNLSLIRAEFDQMDDEIEHDFPLRTDRLITPERRSHILKHRAMINKWLEGLHAEALDDAIKGNPVPGLKAVEGRLPPRKWRSKSDAEEALAMMLSPKLAFSRKVITPKQAEGLLSADDYLKLADIIDKGEPKPVLVDEKDPRPPIRNIAQEFEDDD